MTIGALSRIGKSPPRPTKLGAWLALAGTTHRYLGEQATTAPDQTAPPPPKKTGIVRIFQRLEQSGTLFAQLPKRTTVKHLHWG